jgi:MoaA/NifB/PqqE/SkfB family radical SAM enzyme
LDRYNVAARLVRSRMAELPWSAASHLAYSDGLREAAVRVLDRQLDLTLGRRATRPTLMADPAYPALTWERVMMFRAVLSSLNRIVGERVISPHALSVTTRLWANALLRAGPAGADGDFRRTYGCAPPWFLVISPGQYCNLHCPGCYADSGVRGGKLPWSVLDRIITEAKALWGLPVVVYSGGEPLAYESEGRGILDIAERHPDVLSLFFTNGTLIDEEIAQRLGQVGSLTPALSLEGMREATDRQRGAGTFNKTRKAMSLLREAGIHFGVSLTATRHNYQELLSDSFLDFLFKDQGAFYGFVFMYMPVGRNVDVSLMPTPQQRLAIWRRMWDVIVRKQYFLFDFWNHAPLVHGCLAAGRPAGYFHIDWDGRVTPCVFAPYAGANVMDVFAAGGNLNDVWQAPFFEDIRRWQREHAKQAESCASPRNWLTSCLVRDHYADFRGCIDRNDPVPEDAAARAALDDDAYAAAMDAYDQDLRARTVPLCDLVYSRAAGH